MRCYKLIYMIDNPTGCMYMDVVRVYAYMVNDMQTNNSVSP
jgi:hypothetical protein